MEEQIMDINSKINRKFDAMISVAGTHPMTVDINHVDIFNEYEKSYKSNLESSILRICFITNSISFMLKICSTMLFNSIYG